VGATITIELPIPEQIIGACFWVTAHIFYSLMGQFLGSSRNSTSVWALFDFRRDHKDEVVLFRLGGVPTIPLIA
jgi:hypothetical protein